MKNLFLKSIFILTLSIFIGCESEEQSIGLDTNSATENTNETDLFSKKEYHIYYAAWDEWGRAKKSCRGWGLCNYVDCCACCTDNGEIVDCRTGNNIPKQGAKLIALGYKIIMWDVLSIDWNAQVTPQKCLQNVTTKAKPGSIIVFHDSVKANKNLQYTLPKVRAHFSSKGFIFKCLPS